MHEGLKVGALHAQTVSLLDQMHDGVYIMDTERRITFWNKGAERISGYLRKDMVGKRCDEVPLKHLDTTGCNLCKEYCPAAKSMDQAQPESAVVYLHAADDSIIPVETYIEPIKNENNTVIGAIETFRDISHWQRNEKQAKEKDELIQFFAHDLKNPLTVMRMASKAIAGGQHSELNELLEIMDKKCSFALTLIDELLNVKFSNYHTRVNTKKSISVDEWLKHIVTSHEFLARSKDIKISLDIHDSNLTIHIDPVSFEKIMNNLLCNAIHYSFPGKEVKITTTKVGGFLQIDVQDQGPGIPAKDFEVIFNPFTRSDNKPTQGESSSGLGLYIAKKLVNSFQGNISVKSHYGEGSIFTVKFPLAE